LVNTTTTFGVNLIKTRGPGGIILEIMMGQKNQELFLNFDAISSIIGIKMNFQIEIL